MVNDKFKDTGIPNEKINTETLEESDRKNKNNTNEESINILKDELIKSIWKEKNDAVEYEIPKDIFILKKIDAFGDCLYCCFSFHLYKDQNSHGLIMDEVYD